MTLASTNSLLRTEICSHKLAEAMAICGNLDVASVKPIVHENVCHDKSDRLKVQGSLLFHFVGVSTCHKNKAFLHTRPTGMNGI